MEFTSVSLINGFFLIKKNYLFERITRRVVYNGRKSTNIYVCMCVCECSPIQVGMSLGDKLFAGKNCGGQLLKN